ncbi:hypothetical protein [uncultured Roseibium sp.]|uniref:antibiotic biosynthesis monooxygenase family protein n=1 Tax=uncultured Roseibium sp. TaxID=1936171 RepID=UPI00260E7F75|nr:hypothetical protein [uncultured Roseibium sp.]
MAHRSILVVDVTPGKRDEAIKAFIDRGIISECADAIPAFVSGRVWASDINPDRLNVECDWSEEQGWHDWIASPVRAKQMEDLGHYVAKVVQSEVFAPVDIT